MSDREIEKLRKELERQQEKAQRLQDAINQREREEAQKNNGNR